MPEAGAPREEPDRGVVFAATGATHNRLARRAARTLRAVMPGVAIDLFTDAPPDDPVFDRVHHLERVSRRPKMEALRRSRFGRTLYLDCDVVAVAPVDDIFEVLDRFDLAAAHENRRNGPIAQRGGRGTPPPAFPQVNSGVLALRRSPATRALLLDWEERVHAGPEPYDQPTLRRLLYESDLRLLILPVEYNLMHAGLTLAFSPAYAAPRLLHRPGLHRDGADPGDPMTPFRLEEVVSAEVAARIRALLARDRTLGGAGPLPFDPPPPPPSRLPRFLRAALARLR